MNKKPERVDFSSTESATLLPFLIEHVKGKSRNAVKSLLSRRQVTVGSKIVTQFDHPVRPGDRIAVHSLPELSTERPAGLAIMYEDDEVIVVDKPAGMLSIADAKGTMKNAYAILTEHARESGGRIFVVHRLDRETSGVMVYAKTAEAKHALQENWNDAVLSRTYLAIVEGVVDDEEGVVESWLREAKTYMMYSSLTAGDGLHAVTRFRVLDRKAKFSLLEIELETGRKNQIRVHMKDIGHCVAGDRKYGAKTDPLHGLALHAHVLAFSHPSSGREMRFESPPPAEMTRDGFRACDRL